MQSTEIPVTTGMPSLDETLGGLLLGDNVVWQVDELVDYVGVAGVFAGRALEQGRRTVYFRFAPHPAVLAEAPGLIVLEPDPRPGFDHFSGQVHRMIEEQGPEAFYVFDNLSALVEDWATDELLANFFQVTCPYLRELDTVAYFALTRGRHHPAAVARIRDTTQILIDLYHALGRLYLHPIKVFERYSPRMFLPHAVNGGTLTPVFQSADASTISQNGARATRGAGSIAPWESIFLRLQERTAAGPEAEKSPEVQALKPEFCRMMLGQHPEFSRLADQYLGLDDLFAIRERLIGSGRIGGKAAGMLVARKILLSTAGGVDFSRVLEPHDSFYIGSDVFFTFIVSNGLFRLRLRLTREPQLSADEFAAVEERFLAGAFPDEIMERFREMLDYFGQAPIIVRSSSLLEDSFGNSFAGKYRSEFCANQGSPEERLENFLRAVKLVYASALNPDAICYRRQRGLGDTDEQMAILVQRVSGHPYQDRFFPTLAGVALSHNLYQWTDRIDPRAGMVRLVLGLGTRAVDRQDADYPRMIALSHPTLRPEVGTKVIAYSQRKADMIDLSENRLTTRLLPLALSEGDYPDLGLYLSDVEDGEVRDPVGPAPKHPDRAVVTFNNLLGRTDFVPVMRELLARLEAAYGYPLDTEFTAFVGPDRTVRVNLLQCRPMRLPGAAGEVVMPGGLPPERVLFRAGRSIFGGLVEGLSYIVLVDPEGYAAAEDGVKRSLGRVIGRLNRHPAIREGGLLLMGPGRWGSSNLSLGVNTTYADISQARVLVELAHERAGHLPDLSYGSHFFQDLVEAQVIYLPVYPESAADAFNREFFAGAGNVLSELSPEDEGFATVVKVIDVRRTTGGGTAKVAADPRSRAAVCWVGE